MVDELTSVIEMFQSFKKSGRSATLTMSTKEGQATKIKLFLSQGGSVIHGACLIHLHCDVLSNFILLLLLRFNERS